MCPNTDNSYNAVTLGRLKDCGLQNSKKIVLFGPETKGKSTVLGYRNGSQLLSSSSVIQCNCESASPQATAGCWLFA